MAFEARMNELEAELEFHTLALLRQKHYINKKELGKELFGKYEPSVVYTILGHLIFDMEAKGKIITFYVWNNGTDTGSACDAIYVSLPQYTRELKQQIEKENGVIKI
jgi:hypothetical protein